MLKINENELVSMSVIGEITSPSMRSPYTITADGRLTVLPGTGGITYNVRIGMNACGWQADHVESGVTIKNSNELNNGALNVLSCLGNVAKVVSGDAKGETGYVTGKHGGCEHVLIDFSEKVKEKLVIGDKIQVKTIGVGLKLEDYPEIKVFNISPDLLKRLEIKEVEGILEISVTHYVPAKIMGSGIGRDNVYRGDYDIQLFDEDTVEEYGLSDLKFGDFVAIIDADHSYGRIYKEGAVSIGVVVHSDCVIAGHGPGVMTIFTAKGGDIKPFIDKSANLEKYLY